MSHGGILAVVVPFSTSTCPSVAVLVGFRSPLLPSSYWPPSAAVAHDDASGENDAYQDPRVAAESWRQLFEGDEREIYRKRDLIMKLAAAQSGMTIADVGAGTGLFSMMLSDAVGESGRIYAEDVVEKFSRFVAERAVRESRSNVVSVMGTEVGIGLPPASIDLAFACDVYHHFDHPQEMLASIQRALRPDGELFLVDFSREPGQSPASDPRACA